MFALRRTASSVDGRPSGSAGDGTGFGGRSGSVRGGGDVDSAGVTAGAGVAVVPFGVAVEPDAPPVLPVEGTGVGGTVRDSRLAALEFPVAAGVDDPPVRFGGTVLPVVPAGLAPTAELVPPPFAGPMGLRPPPAGSTWSSGSGTTELWIELPDARGAAGSRIV